MQSTLNNHRMIIYVSINVGFEKLNRSQAQSLIVTKIPSKSTCYKKEKSLVLTFSLLHIASSSSNPFRCAISSWSIVHFHLPSSQNFWNSSSSCSSHSVLHQSSKICFRHSIRCSIFWFHNQIYVDLSRSISHTKRYESYIRFI